MIRLKYLGGLDIGRLTKPSKVRGRPVRNRKYKIPTIPSLSTGPIRLPGRMVPFTASNLKPNTKYRIFSDDTDITKFTRPSGVSRGYRPKGQSATIANQKNRNYMWTNEDGELEFLVFFGRQFRTGVRSQVLRKLVDRQLTDKDDKFSFVPFGKTLNEVTSTVDGKQLTRILPPVSSSGGAFAIAQNPFLPFKKIPYIHTCVFPSQTNDTKYIKQDCDYDFVQTFYVPDRRVKGSKTVDLTEVDLYFKNVPTRSFKRSGKKNPYVTVCLLDLENGLPVGINQYKESLSRKNPTECSPSSNASIPTTFEFQSPIRVATNKFYGIGIIIDDNDYELWTCKTGDRIVGTNKPSPGSSRGHQGELFQNVNTNPDAKAKKAFDKTRKRNIEDLKFEVRCARYNATSVEMELVNEDLEFLSMTSTGDDYEGGEEVYKDVTSETGTITTNAGSRKITGVGTTFTSLEDGESIVVTDGTADNTDVISVDYVVNTTCFYATDRFDFSITGAAFKRTVTALVHNWDPISDVLHLRESSANSTAYLQAGDTIIGCDSGTSVTIDTVDNFPVSAFRPDFDIDTPTKATVRGTFDFSYHDGSNFRISNNASYQETLDMEGPNFLDRYRSGDSVYQPIIMSRSNEAQNTNFLYDSDGDSTGDKSASFLFTYEYRGRGTAEAYESPEMDVTSASISSSYFEINNDSTDEHTNNGNAVSKHISKILEFGEGKNAEDIRVVYNAYRPKGTTFECYAKIINSDDDDAFDDKNWTKLEVTSGEGQFSDPDNRNDYIEYEFGFPDSPPTSSTITGTVDTEDGDEVVTGTGTTFTADLSVGEVVKIYSGVFPENYGIFAIESVDNDTQITLTESVANVNIQSDGLFIDKLETPYTAFNNADNLNIVRYFSATGGTFDTYNAVAIKTVLLSQSAALVPHIDDYRVIGVSA